LTGEKHEGLDSPTQQPQGRAWEPMALTSVGTFGDVLRGNTGNTEDTGLTQQTLT
jgi:hypothetical protein